MVNDNPNQLLGFCFSSHPASQLQNDTYTIDTKCNSAAAYVEFLKFNFDEFSFVLGLKSQFTALCIKYLLCATPESDNYTHIRWNINEALHAAVKFIVHVI